MSIQTIFSIAFLGGGLITTFALWKYLQGLLDAKKRAKLLEIDLERRSINNNISNLSDEELLKRANARADSEGDNTDS